MAKNIIQFQKGISLPQFLSQYGTEEQCRDALFNMRWPQGFQCPKCGHGGFCAISSRKLYQCDKCRFQTSLIQGTIFASTKLPLTSWLLGIYLVTQARHYQHGRCGSRIESRFCPQPFAAGRGS